MFWRWRKKIKYRVRTDRLRLLVTLLVFIAFHLNPANAQKMSDQQLLSSPEKIRLLLEKGELFQVDVPNPHWRRNACTACHTGRGRLSRADLWSPNPETLCGNCHNEFTKAAFMHPTEKTISKTMWEKLPQAFAKSLLSIEGEYRDKVTCYTCHDLKIQCLESRRNERTINANFFRLGPYQNRVTMCFFCHEKKRYKRYSPHVQIKHGELDDGTCRLCHVVNEKLTLASRQADLKLLSEDDLSKLCTGCHPWRPHPGWEFAFGKKKLANHLVKPSPEVQQRMSMTKLKTGIELPLSPDNGEIHCATCHNPHEDGVIDSKFESRDVKIKDRLRLKDSCEYCHDT